MGLMLLQDRLPEQEFHVATNFATNSLEAYMQTAFYKSLPELMQVSSFLLKAKNLKCTTIILQEQKPLTLS